MVDKFAELPEGYIWRIESQSVLSGFYRDPGLISLCALKFQGTMSYSYDPLSSGKVSRVISGYRGDLLEIRRSGPSRNIPWYKRIFFLECHEFDRYEIVSVENVIPESPTARYMASLSGTVLLSVIKHEEKIESSRIKKSLIGKYPPKTLDGLL